MVQNSIVSAQVPGRAELAERLARRDHLPTAEDIRGLWLLFLDEIPKGATGKLQRIGLAEKLEEAGLGTERVARAQAMVTDVIVATPDHSVDGALSLMKDNNIRHLPVIDGNELVGFVSIRDLMLYKLDYVSSTVEFLRDQVHIVNKPLPM